MTPTIEDHQKSLKDFLPGCRKPYCNRLQKFLIWQCVQSAHPTDRALREIEHRREAFASRLRAAADALLIDRSILAERSQ